MRIAVLVYGRINRCSIHYNTIMDTLGQENQIDFFLSSDNASEKHLANFVALYKPVIYSNETVVPQFSYTGVAWDASDRLTNRPVECYRSDEDKIVRHHTNKYRVFCLCETYASDNNVRYDIFISLRVDTVFNDKLIYDKIEENTVYIPEGNDYHGLNDQFAYGDFLSMKIYSLLVMNAYMLIKLGFSDIHPEMLLYSHMVHSNVKVKRIQLKYELDKSRYVDI